MEATILVCAKNNMMPLAQCGGLILRQGDKLLVSPRLAQEIKAQFGAYIISAGSMEVERFRNGNFELLHESAIPKETPGVIGQMVGEISQDKSMLNKARKIKQKG